MDGYRLIQTPRAQCTSPTQANYNLGGACYDALPRLLGDPRVPLTRAVGSNPSPVTVWVQVGTDGRPVSRAPAQQSNDPQFTLLALQYAMNQTSQPAQKDGRAVQAWFQIRLFPGSR